MYKVFKPNSVVLRKYISEFTILKRENFQPIRYFALPHTKSTLSFFSQANIVYNNLSLVIDSKLNKRPLILVLGKYTTPLFLKYKDFVDEIAINFTPTGINFFFDHNFDSIAPNPVQFHHEDTWIKFSAKLFEKEEEIRIEYLERFLLSQLRHKKLSQIEYIINKLENDKSLKIKNISLKMKVSERTINRWFHKYIGCPPKDYKKIMRFRSSLKMNNEEMNLTELCLNNDYYDSPHFTNEFKLLTNKSPRDFFNTMSEVGEERFPYIFL